MSAEPQTYVRWSRRRGGWSAWHRNAPIDADSHGRTQCGRRWPRRGAEVVPEGHVSLSEGHHCENCKNARKGTYPTKDNDA